MSYREGSLGSKICKIVGAFLLAVCIIFGFVASVLPSKKKVKRDYIETSKVNLMSTNEEDTSSETPML